MSKKNEGKPPCVSSGGKIEPGKGTGQIRVRENNSQNGSEIVKNEEPQRWKVQEGRRENKKPAQDKKRTYTEGG